MPTDSPSARPTARPEILAAAAIVLTLGLLIVVLRGAYALGWLPLSTWTGPVLAVGVAFILCGVILLAQAWQRQTLLRVAYVAPPRDRWRAARRSRLRAVDRRSSVAGPRARRSSIRRWRYRSAEMFLVIATGLIAYDPPWRSRARAPIVAAFASLLAVICVVQLSVSMRDTGLTYGWEYFTFLSPHVVIGFFTLACALFARAWTDDQQRRPAGPSWIPIPIAAVLICATFMLWHALRVEEWEHLQEQTQSETVEMKEALTDTTRQYMQAMVRVASRWQHQRVRRSRELGRGHAAAARPLSRHARRGVRHAGFLAPLDHRARPARSHPRAGGFQSPQRTSSRHRGQRREGHAASGDLQTDPVVG